MTIICYGDSNTYGYDPRLGGSGRYGQETRWTGILKRRMKTKLENHGICGRCIPHRSSQIEFACTQIREWTEREGGIELWIMLGTNDLLQEKEFMAEDVAGRLDVFLERLQESMGMGNTGSESIQAIEDSRTETEQNCLGCKIRIIAPPLMQYGAWVNEKRIYEESGRLGSLYQKLAQKRQTDFTDAGKWQLPVAFDGVHLTEEGHQIFAERMLREAEKWL